MRGEDQTYVPCSFIFTVLCDVRWAMMVRQRQLSVDPDPALPRIGLTEGATRSCVHGTPSANVHSNVYCSRLSGMRAGIVSQCT